MAEIGIHFEDIAVAGRIGKTYFETLDIGCAESEFAGTLMELYPSGELLLEGAYSPRGAVGRPVVDHKHVKFAVTKGHDSAYDRVDILYLVVCRYDYYALMHGCVIRISVRLRPVR